MTGEIKACSDCEHAQNVSYYFEHLICKKEDRRVDPDHWCTSYKEKEDIKQEINRVRRADRLFLEYASEKKGKKKDGRKGVFGADRNS